MNVLRERRMGEFDATTVEAWHKQFASFDEEFAKSPGGVETFHQCVGA